VNKTEEQRPQQKNASPTQMERVMVTIKTKIAGVSTSVLIQLAMAK
jgi:hypothetical protein